MAQVWINPAFKDKIKPEKPEKTPKSPETKKTEEETVKKEKTKKEPKKSKEKPPEAKKKESAPKTRQENTEDKEARLFNYLREKQIPIEAWLTGELTIKGTIKWFSKKLLALETKNKTLITDRLNFLYYRYKAENIPDEKELNSFPLLRENPEKILFQEYKDNKTPLQFHLPDNIKITGTFRWYEKLTYHIKSLDEKKDFNIHRSSILYFEEA